MEHQPDLTFYFAIHQAQRDAISRYRHAVSTLEERDRPVRAKALRRWAKGFALELDEHHHVEDRFFFPSLQSRVPTAATVLDRFDRDHGRLDELLARWPALAAALADTRRPFLPARAALHVLADELHELLHLHLSGEDEDVLPLFWRHYTSDEYDAVFQQAVKQGKKAGLWFVAPFSVDCYPAGPEREAFLAAVPRVLRVFHRLVRPSYDRLEMAAFGPTPVRA